MIHKLYKYIDKYKNLKKIARERCYFYDLIIFLIYFMGIFRFLYSHLPFFLLSWLGNSVEIKNPIN